MDGVRQTGLETATKDPGAHHTADGRRVWRATSERPALCGVLAFVVAAIALLAPVAVHAQASLISPLLITSITPDNGSETGGETITIEGLNLPLAASVVIDGTHAAVVGRSATRIDVTTPPHAPGTVDVGLADASGAVSYSGRFTYIGARSVGIPSFSAISPDWGSSAGGETVTLTGVNLDGVTHLVIGNVAAQIVAASSTQLSVVTPIIDMGATSRKIVPIRLVRTSHLGVDEKFHMGEFTYFAPPDISAIAPGSGSTAGGDYVTISGGYLDLVTSVRMGGVNAQIFSMSSAGITIVTPAHAQGTVDVELSYWASAAMSFANAFTYADPPPGAVNPRGPSLVAVSPGFGPIAGGDAVSLTGANLNGAISVVFGGVPALITGSYPSGIDVVTPAHVTGTVDVSVTTAAGTVTLAAAYTFVDVGIPSLTPPVVVSISPAQGRTDGGAKIRILGGDLDSVISVSFGGTTAAIVGSSHAFIDVISPAHEDGTTDVVVVTAAGSVTVTGGFTYLPGEAAQERLESLPAITNSGCSLGCPAGFLPLLLALLFLQGGARFCFSSRSAPRALSRFRSRSDGSMIRRGDANSTGGGWIDR